MEVSLPIAWAPIIEVFLVALCSGACALVLLPEGLGVALLVAILIVLALGYSPDVPLVDAAKRLQSETFSAYWPLPSGSRSVHVRRWPSRLDMHAANQRTRRVCMVCLHGTFSSSHEFEEWAEALHQIANNKHVAGIAVEIVAIDLPGHGLTGPWVHSEPGVHPYSVDSDVLFLHNVITSMPMAGADVVLVGHSIGGAIAVAYAARHPSHVVALVLMSPWGLRHGANDPCMAHCVWFIKFVLSPRWRFLNLWLCLLLIRFTPRFLVRYAMGTAFGRGPPRVENARIVSAAHKMQAYMLVGGNRRTFVARIANFVTQERHALQARAQCRAHLSALRCPVQLQWGEADTWLHVSRSEAWAASLAHCMSSEDKVLFPGVGHVVPEQVPQESAAATWRFIKRVCTCVEITHPAPSILEKRTIKKASYPLKHRRKRF